jgi:hypothetical protein
VARTRSGWPRRAGATALAVLVLGVGFGLAQVLREQGIDAAVSWAALASTALGAVALVPLMADGWRRRVQLTVSTPQQVDQARRILARLVLEQWRDEILIRQLDDPAPLTVRWRLTELPVMDHPAGPVRTGMLHHMLARGRPRFTGRTDRIADMVEDFRDLPRRRLVILGDPGMGKTTLAVLLLRRMLEAPRPDEPVPVIFTMSGWDPGARVFGDWLTQRLTETYPALRAEVLGPDAPHALVAERRILPILDGLDELPESTRPKVITALNAALSETDALILTCRTAEYEAAMSATEGDVLTAGAVIEPRPVEATDAAAYLAHSLPPRPRGSWPALLGTLTKDPNCPLAQALRTPLALWLLRKVYIDAHTDPGPLLTPGRFTSADQITDHLLDHLVDALVTGNPSRTGGGDDEHHPFRPHRTWAPEDARRWLSFLARHLDATNAADLAWWRLHDHLPRRTIRLATALISGLVLGLTGFALGSLKGLTTGLLSGFLLGCSLGLTGWVASAMPTGPNAEPTYADLRLRGRTRSLSRGLTYDFPNRFVTALMSGLAAGVAGGLAFGPVSGLTFGLTVETALALLAWAENPQAGGPAQTPPRTIRRDLQLVYLRTVAFGLLLGLGGAITTSLVVGVADGPVPGLVGGLAVGLAFGLVGALASCSGTYFIAASFLYLRGQAPRRLMRFLEDAHRLGLLRQTGPVYQFRHAKLQDRLANTHTNHR